MLVNLEDFNIDEFNKLKGGINVSVSEIYAVCINEVLTDYDLEWLRQKVSPLRVEKSGKYYFPDDAKRCLVAGIILRVYCKIHNLNISEEMETLNKYGKPYWISSEAPKFSISHSGEWVVCGFDNKEIGIDIEKIQHGDTEQTAKQLATPEYEYIMACDGPKKMERFVRIWTLKESYTKYLGYGLSIPLQSFSVYHTNLLSEKGDEIKTRYRNVWLKQKKFHKSHYLSECSHTEDKMNIKVLAFDEIKKIIGE